MLWSTCRSAIFNLDSFLARLLRILFWGSSTFRDGTLLGILSLDARCMYNFHYFFLALQSFLVGTIGTEDVYIPFWWMSWALRPWIFHLQSSWRRQCSVMKHSRSKDQPQRPEPHENQQVVLRPTKSFETEDVLRQSVCPHYGSHLETVSNIQLSYLRRQRTLWSAFLYSSGGMLKTNHVLGI